MVVKAEFIYYNITINEVTSIIENIQCKQIDKKGFNENYMTSVICHTEYD